MDIGGGLLLGAAVLIVLSIGAALRWTHDRDHGPVRIDPLVAHEMTPDPPRDPGVGYSLEEEIGIVIEVYRLDRYQPPVARDLRRIARKFGGGAP